jgi:predicted transcriptional regulator
MREKVRKSKGRGVYVWRRRRSLSTIIRKIVSVGVAVLKKGRKVMA